MYAEHYSKKDQELEISEKLMEKMRKMKEEVTAKMDVVYKERDEMDRINKELFQRIEERDQELKSVREALKALKNAKNNDAFLSMGSGKINEMKDQIDELKKRE